MPRRGQPVAVGRGHGAALRTTHNGQAGGTVTRQAQRTRLAPRTAECTVAMRLVLRRMRDLSARCSETKGTCVCCAGISHAVGEHHGQGPVHAARGRPRRRKRQRLSARRGVVRSGRLIPGSLPADRGARRPAVARPTLVDLPPAQCCRCCRSLPLYSFRQAMVLHLNSPVASCYVYFLAATPTCAPATQQCWPASGRLDPVRLLLPSSAGVSSLSQSPPQAGVVRGEHPGRRRVKGSAGAAVPGRAGGRGAAAPRAAALHPGEAADGARLILRDAAQPATHGAPGHAQPPRHTRAGRHQTCVAADSVLTPGRAQAQSALICLHTSHMHVSEAPWPHARDCAFCPSTCTRTRRNWHERSLSPGPPRADGA